MRSFHVTALHAFAPLASWRDAEPPDPPAPVTPPLSGAEFTQAFEALYATGFRSLYTYLDRLTGDAALAADLAQEAYLRLHARGRLPDQPAAWLVTVAHNLLRDASRTRRRRLRLLAADSAAAPSGTEAPPPDAAVLAEEHRRLVRDALDHLPERDRRLLLLRHSGYSYREIAETLALNPASVGTLLVRATTAFRRAYEDRHADD